MSDETTEPSAPVAPAQGFVLGNKLYDKLKFLVQVVLPGVGTLYAGLGGFWNFPHIPEVIGSITAVALFLGLLLGQSSKNFVPPVTAGMPVGDMIVKDSVEVEGKKTVEFSLDVYPEEFLENDVVQFRVSRGENSL